MASQNDLNQIIEDASRCIQELDTEHTRFNAVQSAYREAAEKLSKQFWTSIQLAFVNYAKNKCQGLVVPFERVAEFRQIAFPFEEYQGLNLMLRRLQEFYLINESTQTAAEFDHYAEMTKQLIQNIESSPPPEPEMLVKLKAKFVQ